MTLLSRREFVASTLAAPFAFAEDKPRRVPVVDTHVHCFAGARDRDFPYHRDAPYKPAEAATPKDLLTAMAGAGVDHAVIVHPEPYQDDHRYQEYCLKIGGKRLKGTCLLFADRPGVLAEIAGVLGKHQISIASVIQHEPSGDGKVRTVPLVIMTYKAAEGSAQAAMAEIDELKCTRPGSVRMRVLD